MQGLLENSLIPPCSCLAKIGYLLYKVLRRGVSSSFHIIPKTQCFMVTFVAFWVQYTPSGEQQMLTTIWWTIYVDTAYIPHKMSSFYMDIIKSLGSSFFSLSFDYWNSFLLNYLIIISWQFTFRNHNDIIQKSTVSLLFTILLLFLTSIYNWRL